MGWGSKSTDKNIILNTKIIENATQASSLKTDNTREADKGQPPPTQVKHDFYLFFITTEQNCDVLLNTIKLHI